MNTTIFIIILAVLIFDYILERYLEYINAKHRTAPIPEEVQGIYDEQEYKKQQEYEAQKSKFGLITASFSFVLILILLLTGGFAFIDSYIYSSFGSEDAPLSHITGALLFFAVLFFGSDILGIPFDIYHTFVLEERFGFNKTTVKTFILDKLKSWILTIILGGGILYVLLWLISTFEAQFWIYAWGVLATIMIFFTMFYSNLIVPLFNKQTPLEEGELKDAINAFASKVGFTLQNIYVIDGSKRSTKANAYFTGLGSKKRIVLYDTLIQDLSTQEIVAVLAHEIGHYKKKHTLQMILASLVQTGVLLYILGLFLAEPALTESLGIAFESGKYHIALFVFGILYSPLSFIIGILMNMVSRKNEFEADSYAATEYDAESLINALKKLVKKNLSNLTPHPRYVFFYYSHPPVDARIRNMRKKS